MTDFEKVKNYYRHFDEKNRLQNDNSGKLEFLITMRIIMDLKKSCCVLSAVLATKKKM